MITLIYIILIIFIIVTALFIILILYLIISTENFIDDFDPDRTYALYFDNTTETSFRYKYLIKIVFDQVPREVQDYLKQKQPHPPDSNLFGLWLMDEMKQHLGAVLVNTDMLCKYLMPSTVGRTQTLKILVFGNLRIASVHRVHLALLSDNMRVTVHDIVIYDILEGKSFVFKINCAIKMLPPNPRGRGREKQDFRISSTESFDPRTVTRPVTLKSYEYLCFLYMTFSAIISLSIAFFIRTTYFPVKLMTENIWTTSAWTSVYTCTIVIPAMSYYRFYLNEQQAKLLNYRYWSRFKWSVLSFILVSSFVLSCLSITFVVIQCQSEEADCPLWSWLTALGLATLVVAVVMTIALRMLRKAKFFRSKH